jgi:hypothetical protein
MRVHAHCCPANRSEVALVVCTSWNKQPRTRLHVFLVYRGIMAETHREGRLGFEDTLNFTNTLCIAYTLCSAILRGWIRRGIYGIDDLVIAAATFSTLGFFAANYVALEHSAGKPWHYIEAAHDVASFNRVRPFHTRCNQIMNIY